MTPALVPLVTAQSVAFWVLAPVMVIAALGIVLSRKPIHSALCLATVMISLAVQYAAQDAPFLFAVQIVVYTGAVLMLFLFVVMLIGVRSADSLVETLKGQRIAAIVAALGLLILLIFAVGNAVVDGQAAGLGAVNAASGGNVPGLAQLLFSDYVLVFEATSALLITAALGSMVLAHRERIGGKVNQRKLVSARMKRYAETGEHPGTLPTPGVYARHNAVDIPALLPDGMIAEQSVPAPMRARGTVLDGPRLADATRATVAALDGDPNAVNGQRGPGRELSAAPHTEAAHGQSPLTDSGQAQTAKDRIDPEGDAQRKGDEA